MLKGSLDAFYLPSYYWFNSLFCFVAKRNSRKKSLLAQVFPPIFEVWLTVLNGITWCLFWILLRVPRTKAKIYSVA